MGFLILILLVFAVIAGVIVSYTEESNRISFIKKFAAISGIPFVATVVFILVTDNTMFVTLMLVALVFFSVVFAIAAGVSSLMSKTLYHFVLIYICVFMLVPSLLVILLFVAMAFAAI